MVKYLENLDSDLYTHEQFGHKMLKNNVKITAEHINGYFSSNNLQLVKGDIVTIYTGFSHLEGNDNTQ